jgi:hypothetical protein
MGLDLILVFWKVWKVPGVGSAFVMRVDTSAVTTLSKHDE